MYTVGIFYPSKIQYNCSRLRLDVKYMDGSRYVEGSDDVLTIRDLRNLYYNVYVLGKMKRIVELYDVRQDSPHPITSLGGFGSVYF